MYACQIWGTKYLQEGAEFNSQLQKLHLCSLKRMLGVKRTTSNWSVLRECGQEPLQFYWFRATVKFYNSMLEANSSTLRQVVKADVQLSGREASCWSAQVLDAFKGLRSCDKFTENILSLKGVPLQEFVADLRHRHQQVWRDVDRQDPRVHTKKAATYQNWFSVPLNTGVKGPFVP